MSTHTSNTFYSVKAFNGVAEQYYGDSEKEANEIFIKSHTATHLYKITDNVRTLIKENLKRMKHPGAMKLAFDN